MEYIHTRFIDNQEYLVASFTNFSDLIFYAADKQLYYEDLVFSDFPANLYNWLCDAKVKKYGNELLDNLNNCFYRKINNNYYKFDIRFYFKEIYSSAKFKFNNQKKFRYIKTKTYKGNFRQGPVEGIHNKRHSFKTYFRNPKVYHNLKQLTDPDPLYRSRKRKQDVLSPLSNRWLDDTIRSQHNPRSWKNQKKKRQWMKKR